MFFPELKSFLVGGKALSMVLSNESDDRLSVVVSLRSIKGGENEAGKESTLPPLVVRGTYAEVESGLIKALASYTQTVESFSSNIAVIEQTAKDLAEAKKKEADAKGKTVPRKVAGSGSASLPPDPRLSAPLDTSHVQSLVGIPANDSNFKGALEKASQESLQQAATDLSVRPNAKTTFERVSAELKKLTGKSAEDRGILYKGATQQSLFGGSPTMQRLMGGQPPAASPSTVAPSTVLPSTNTQGTITPSAGAQPTEGGGAEDGDTHAWPPHDEDEDGKKDDHCYTREPEEAEV